MNYMNLRPRRTPLPSATPIVPLKKVNYDQRSFNYDLWKIIFDFIHPSLIHLMIPFRSIKSMNSTPHLPLDLVISWNDFAKFDQFKKVLLSFNFRSTLLWLKTHFPTEFSEILKDKSGNPLAIAAREGDIEVFKWLRNNGAKWDKSTLKAAYQKGHHNIVDWAIMNGCPKGVYKREGKPPARKRNGRLKLSPYRR